MRFGLPGKSVACTSSYQRPKFFFESLNSFVDVFRELVVFGIFCCIIKNSTLFLHFFNRFLSSITTVSQSFHVFLQCDQEFRFAFS